MNEPTHNTTNASTRWGLWTKEVEGLGNRLRAYYEQYCRHLRTKTRDTSEYGFWYLSGLLRMESKRTMAGIGRSSNISEQNMQHFISNSPWSAEPLVADIHGEIRVHPAFQSEAMLIFDESADGKTGDKSAGAGRQHNGRLGKIEMSQVGVFASLVTPQVNLWVDGELYLPKHWFDDDYQEQRTKVGIPKERVFRTKPELVWDLVQRIQHNQVPFVAVAMDDLYGRNNELRQQLDGAGIEYYGDVPANTRIYFDKPSVRYVQGKRAKKLKRTVAAQESATVAECFLKGEMERATVTLRPSERGMLVADFARCRVWTLVDDTPRQEWLLVRRSGKYITYVLSNAPATASLQTMAWRKSHRYFIERSNQDAKSELGWDDFQATKYLAWQHHLAFTILASWFVAQTRLDWLQRFPPDPALLVDYQTNALPQLSVANVRELLRAAMPLPQLSSEQAIDLVMQHLVNRTRSRTSRLRRQPFLPSQDPVPEM